MDKPAGNRRKRRSFTKDFKQEAAKLVIEGNRSVAQVAEDLDLTETSLRAWVSQVRIDAGDGPADALTSDERAELSRLRRETKQLRMEREILKKAAAFFAKEST